MMMSDRGSALNRGLARIAATPTSIRQVWRWINLREPTYPFIRLAGFQIIAAGFRETRNSALKVESILQDLLNACSLAGFICQQWGKWMGKKREFWS
jgi:hypothetical protein